MSTTQSGSSGTATSGSPHRPISKAEASNPREFQLNQLRRRFHPKESSDDTGTTATFGLTPSDPDFPFEMDKLLCILHVPLTYPTQGRPTIKVTNPEMGSAFQENVARGFDDIVDSAIRGGSRGTLLSYMNTLDRHLERLLTTLERGPTLKFVPNTTASKPQSAAAQKLTRGMESLAVSPSTSQPRTQVLSTPKPAPVPTYTAAEKAQAEKRRAAETKQLEARLGRLSSFQKLSNGLSFLIPIQPAKIDRLPVPLRSVKAVKLQVPQLYPLEPSAIELNSIEGPEARAVEAGFSKWVENNLNLNLMSQVNYLTSNMLNFSKTSMEHAPTPAAIPEIPDSKPSEEAVTGPPVPESVATDKPHVHVVPRPPEWNVGGDSSASEETDFTESDEEPTEDDEDGGAPVPDLPEPTNVERGVALSFPFLELYGIELLELVGLYITIKCDRCKETMDVRNIPQIRDKNDELSLKVETCKKCANTMSMGFRRQLMHPTATRAGYLDLDGCTVVDLLPSSFLPTCAECSTPFPSPGIVAVRGESAMANCRQCHRKMVLKVPEVKFLKVGSAAFSSRDRPPPRKKPKEVLGIVAGQELPRRGRCSHYGKSYRWFRFSCCAKVFPCDKCHDAATDHPNEHANRMICGFCSREQIYRPENCGICRAVVIGKAGSGFWEGGKGTRNKTLMSRKDPRKYKRRGGTTPGGSSKKT
ncbi:CHY zinc finger domain protein [Aspergillus indologenus CBS 114.80]|uniref:CHY zinc finger domain protein n=1 Tax=Aspergillus indologenus CBS 114.80 TaxID=1450541 RepID=A0A2V5IG55_9EURO|nr:CHY zinc finger domain protein [Aspergillus indologenus CBS 114.80]